MSRPRPRHLVAGAMSILTLAVLALSLGACSLGDDGALGPEVTSPPRQSAGSDRSDSDRGTSDGGSSSEDEGSDTGPGTSLPDLGDLDDCVGLAGTYAGLAFSVIGGPDAAAEAQPVIDELRPRLPENLQDDLDVVAEAFSRIVEDGVLEGISAVADPEFREANGNITGYLQENCFGG